MKVLTELQVPEHLWLLINAPVGTTEDFVLSYSEFTVTLCICVSGLLPSAATSVYIYNQMKVEILPATSKNDELRTC